MNYSSGGTVILKFSSGETLEVSRMLLYLFTPCFKEFFTEFPHYNDVIKIPAYIEYTAFDAFLKNILVEHTEIGEKISDAFIPDVCNLNAYLLLPLPSIESLRDTKIEDNIALDRYLACLHHYGDSDDATLALLSCLKISDLSKLALPPAVKDKCMAMLTPGMIHIVADEEYIYVIGWDELIEIGEEVPSEFGLGALWNKSSDGKTDYYNIKGDIVKSIPYTMVKRSFGASGGILHKLDEITMESVASFKCEQLKDDEPITSFAVDGDLAAIKGNGDIYIYSFSKRETIATIHSRRYLGDIRFLDDYLFVFTAGCINTVILYSRAKGYTEAWRCNVETSLCLSPSGKVMIINGKAIDVRTKDWTLNDIVFNHKYFYGSSDDELFQIKKNKCGRVNLDRSWSEELIDVSEDIKAYEYLHSPQVARDQELYDALMKY